MSLQTDPLSRTNELFRDLGTSLLSGTKAVACWQIDSLQESMTRNSQQLRAVMSESCAANKPADTIQHGIRNAIKMSRDYLIATTDYQMENARLLQNLGSDIQQIITDALNEQLLNLDVVATPEQQNSRVATVTR